MDKNTQKIEQKLKDPKTNSELVQSLKEKQKILEKKQIVKK